MTRLVYGVERHGPCLSLCLDELHLHRHARLAVHGQNSCTLGKAHLVARTSGIGLSEATDVLQDSITACRKMRQFLLSSNI